VLSNKLIFLFIEDDRMSDASVDISKASRSGSSHSESSHDGLNDDEDETPYVAASPEELGEVKKIYIFIDLNENLLIFVLAW
jgi:hypothetical protein